MPQTSRPVQRVMTILNFFAEHPRQTFSLTQVIKGLRMSRTREPRAWHEAGWRGHVADRRHPHAEALDLEGGEGLVPVDVRRRMPDVSLHGYGMRDSRLEIDQAAACRGEAIERRPVRNWSVQVFQL